MLLPTTTARQSIDIAVSPDPDAGLLAAWDAMVGGSPAGDVAQLSAWTVLRRKAGFEPLWVHALRAGELVGGAQVLCRRLPVFGTIGYVPYGPLVGPVGDDRPAVLGAVADTLEHVGRRRFRMLFVQPPEDGADASEYLMERGFRASSAGIAPAASMHVDLSASEDELRRGLSKRLRTWTNQWPARGVTVRLGEATDLPLLHELLADTARHQGFEPLSADYLAVLHRELVGTGHAVVFVGEVDGHPVAMDVVTSCGEVAKVRFVGLDRSSTASKLNVPGAIRWEAIRWAKATGHRWFDFGGLREASARALLSGGPVDVEALDGPDRYKIRFGGTAYRYPAAVELIASPVVRTLYEQVGRSTRGRRAIGWVKDRVRFGRGDART